MFLIYFLRDKRKVSIILNLLFIKKLGVPFLLQFFETPDCRDSIAATLWKCTRNGQQGAIQLLRIETKDYPSNATSCLFVVPIK